MEEPPPCLWGRRPELWSAPSRVVLMLRERWHFCRDGRVLLGSRALRERHLGLMGYQLLPVSVAPASPLPRPGRDLALRSPSSPPSGPRALWVTCRPLSRSYPSRNWSHREACRSSRAT